MQICLLILQTLSDNRFISPLVFFRSFIDACPANFDERLDTFRVATLPQINLKSEG